MQGEFECSTFEHRVSGHTRHRLRPPAWRRTKMPSPEVAPRRRRARPRPSGPGQGPRKGGRGWAFNGALRLGRRFRFEVTDLTRREEHEKANRPVRALQTARSALVHPALADLLGGCPLLHGKKKAANCNRQVSPTRNCEDCCLSPVVGDEGRAWKKGKRKRQDLDRK